MRYFIYFSYDGTNYHGWQIQPNANSVQEELQKALPPLPRRWPAQRCLTAGQTAKTPGPTKRLRRLPKHTVLPTWLWNSIPVSAATTPKPC